ncbi:MAG TPA: cupredoxin domain-containing protein [Candidatus Eisenbacteria bacterium]|nr:cupredoxin domain-containing protein [Candidatus Eisenbacteria bacterium]
MRHAIALFPILALMAAGCGGTKGAEIPVSVTENGFEPSRIEVEHDQPVTLLVTRKTDQTCATEIVVPSRGITQSLPLNQTVRVALGPLQTGEVAFACGMDMEKGTIAVR